MEYNDISFARHLAGLASLNSHHKPAADPATLTPIQLVDKMIQIEDHVRTIYVRNDKPADAKSKDHVTGLDLSLSSELALLLKLLLLRMIVVMLNRTILKPMLLRGKIFSLLAFGFFMCPPMLAMLPARVLHSTRLIHT